VDERFYITTAINYTNGHPHIGHAYEVRAAAARHDTGDWWRKCANGGARARRAAQVRIHIVCADVDVQAVTADVVARYHRVAGREVFFLTGSDEHGKKVQQSAEQAGLQPIDVANRYSAGFQALNAKVCGI
jgi:methionyl-tRNA synthetase